ncbi:hypothetical protein pEaSNUABM11_00129 [Erwinia phage pEa_SNUABM_11]|nr:hypothetical protein pEaSNUABM11_00129 [Erwinia phage pEa_SNUABM_11]
MLTIINSLNEATFIPELAESKQTIEQFLDTVSNVPFDQFAHLNDDFEVDKLAICILDADVVSVVVQDNLDKESIKSLMNYYTTAKSVRVYHADRNDFPSGDDWTVEGLSFVMADCVDQGMGEKYTAEQEGTVSTIHFEDGMYVGTRLDDLKSFSVIAAGEYDNTADPVIRLAMQYCADQQLGLLVQCQNNTWVKPMLDMGFTANRWILKADFATL